MTTLFALTYNDFLIVFVALMEFIRYLYQKRRNVSLPILRVKCNNLMLRKRDFSLLIAITERSLWFYRSTIVISLSCRSKHDVNEGFFFIIYNTFSYPGGQDRKWRAELLNWKCLQFYQPEIIILQNARIVLVFSYVSQIMLFFVFKQPHHLPKTCIQPF